MTPLYIDDIHISIAAPSAPQWLTAMDVNKRFCHVGHCNNAFNAGLKAIALGWMKFEDAEGFPLTPDLRRCGYMCDAYAMDKGVKLPAILPDAYIDSISKWREISPGAGIPKSVLPAFVPSVSFNYKFIRKWQKDNQDDRKKYLSAKALAGRDPRAWSHTGLFCIDIDAGHDGNPEAPDALYAQAHANGAFSLMPGFLFSFASPNQGIKLMFKVDPVLLALLNAPDGCGDADLESPDVSEDALVRVQSLREKNHAICFYAIAAMVSRHTGLAVDLSCSDPCRLQFMFRAHASRYELNPCLLDSDVPDSLLPGFSIDGADAWREHEETAARRGAGGSAVLPRNFEPGNDNKPDCILRFADWLKSRGWLKEAQHVLDMAPGPRGYYSFCLQCRDASSTPSGPRDLLLWLDRDSPGRFGFKCLHDSCQSRAKVKYPFWYLAKLYHEEQEALKIAHEASNSYQVPEPIRKFIRTRSELSEHKIIIGNIGMVQSSFKSPDALPNLFEWDEKTGALLTTALNVSGYVRHCMGLYPVYNKDLCCNEFISPDTGMCFPFDAVRKAVLGYFMSRCNKDVSKQFLFTSLHEAQGLSYSPLFALGYWEEWDGVPRVDQYIDLLEWDPARQPPKILKEDGTPMSGQEWKRHALRSWLVNCWERTVCSVIGSDKVPTFGGRPSHLMPENKMIILCSETQGVGKTQWVKGLVGSKAQESLVIADKLEQSKDHDKISAIKPIFFLDEMEKTTKNEEMNSHLKMVLTRSHIDIRDPYEKDIMHRKVVTSFIGATNEPKPLSDADGSRRLVLLYVRRPADKMGSVGNCPEHVKEMQSLNVAQFWAEIKYLSETAKPGEYALTPQETNLVHYNQTTALENGEFNHLVSYLRFIPSNYPAADGKQLRKMINGAYNDPANIINSVRRYLGEREIKVSWRGSKQFRQHLLAQVPEGCSPTYYTGKRGSPRVALYPVMLESEFELLASDTARKSWARDNPEEAAKYYKRIKFGMGDGSLVDADPAQAEKLDIYKPYYDQYMEDSLENEDEE